jgi:hexosaminidase
VYEAAIADAKNNIFSNFVKQEFSLNKATGKKISILYPASSSYAGNGAFTLVDGVQNKMGMSRSAEFLGFSGKDLVATIDLGEATNISEVRIHAFTQTASWIYPPAQGIKIEISEDGKDFSFPQEEIENIGPDDGIHKIWFSFSHQRLLTRFLKITVKNYGIIPPPQPGAGNSAWLFVDEIEVF